MIDINEESSVNLKEISSQLLSIDSIKIGNRFRKDLGDIASLATNIAEVGLLRPIAVNQNNELICGMRTIEAFKVLGRREIPAHTVNLDDIVKGQISENIERKDFSWEEILEIKKAVEPEIRKESERRMLSGKPSAKFADGSRNNMIAGYYSENQTRAKVANYVSSHGKKISHATLVKAEAVYDVARKQPDTFGQIWTQLNNEKIKPHKAFKSVQKIQRRQELLAEKAAVILPKGAKLIQGDFREKCADIPNDSIHLIFTDPLYGKEFLPLYHDIAKVAAGVLTDGGSIVTYCGGDLESMYQIIGFMRSRGLTPWWGIPVIHAGPFERVYPKHVVVTHKPLLWFVKGTKLRTSDFIRDSVVSRTPDKTLHGYSQSIVEAEYVILRLTFENDIVLDPMMGVGTTGVAALKLKRQFIGVEKDQETFKIVRARIDELLHQDKIGSRNVPMDGEKS